MQSMSKSKTGPRAGRLCRLADRHYLTPRSFANNRELCREWRLKGLTTREIAEAERIDHDWMESIKRRLQKVAQFDVEREVILDLHSKKPKYNPRQLKLHTDVSASVKLIRRWLNEYQSIGSE